MTEELDLTRAGRPPVAGGALDHGPIAASPLTLDQADALAALMHALGDRTRVRIVSALLHSETGELHGRALREQLSLSQATVSHHLHKLVRVGVLVREQRGPYGYFRVAPDAFARLRAIFGECPVTVTSDASADYDGRGAAGLRSDWA